MALGFTLAINPQALDFLLIGSQPCFNSKLPLQTTAPHRFGGRFVPLDTLAVWWGACVWAVAAAAAVFADVSWLSYVHPAVLAESLAAVWQLRQAATWEQAGRGVRPSSVWSATNVVCSGNAFFFWKEGANTEFAALYLLWC